nr:hypothetical protein TetV2_00074 [Oceanusvirus sp.]
MILLLLAALAAVAAVVAGIVILMENVGPAKVGGHLGEFDKLFLATETVSVSLIEFFDGNEDACYPRHSALKLESEKGMAVTFELITPDLAASIYTDAAPADVYFSLTTPLGAFATDVARVSGTVANALVEEMRAFRKAAAFKRHVLAKVVVNDARPAIDVSSDELRCRTVGGEADPFVSTDEVVGTQLTCDDFTSHCIKWLDDVQPVQNRGALRRNHILIRGTDAEVVPEEDLDAWYADRRASHSIDARRVGKAIDTELRSLVAESEGEMYWRCLDIDSGETIHVRIVDPSIDAISVPLFPESADTAPPDDDADDAPDDADDDADIELPGDDDDEDDDENTSTA